MGPDYTDYYSIVPLWDMNQNTGATAIVPGSHRRVTEIRAVREQHGGANDWTGPGSPYIEPFRAAGLRPAVSRVKAGDMVSNSNPGGVSSGAQRVAARAGQVIFDTALYHAGCAAEDPTGLSGNGPAELLRAVYILGMTPTRLQSRVPSPPPPPLI